MIPLQKDAKCGQVALAARKAGAVSGALVSAEPGSKLKPRYFGSASLWPWRMAGRGRATRGTIAMVDAAQRSYFKSSLLAAITILLAVAIFSVDAFTNLGMAIAALYSVVILLSSRFLDRRGVLFVSLGCGGLTIAAYLLSHGLAVTGLPMLRFLVSLAAIATTAFLALEDKAASVTLRERAGLLDLTGDGIFVRDMNEVITYWNRGAEEAYGWTAGQVVGKATTHDLLHTVFPAPLDRINAELLQTGRWEGELVHTKADGTRMVVSSRWALLHDERQRPVAILETNNDITEQKRGEDRLRRSEAYQSEAQRLSQVGSFGWEIATDKVFWSEEAYRIFGYDRAIVPTPAMVIERTHPEDRELVLQTIEQARREGLDFDSEYRLLMPDGAVKHVHIVARTTKDSTGEMEVVGAVMDVTSAKEAENRIRRIIDTVPASLWRARPDGSVDYISERVQQYLGMSMHEALAPGWGAHIHPDDYAEAHSNWLAAVAERKLFESVFRLRRFDGEYRWFLGRAMPLLDRAGNILAWYGSDTDIHDRKLAEEALLKVRADLAHVTRVTTLGELSASIAHEVNQPLAAIVTNGEVGLQLLDSDVPDLAETREVLAAMISDGRRASEIIRRLRTLTMKTEPQKSELDLNDIIADVMRLVREEVVSKNVSLRLELAPALPSVLGDRVQLQQVIINLLLNAIEAMAAVDGRPRELVIRSQMRDPGHVLIGCRIRGPASSRRPRKRSSRRSTPPSRMAWAWGYRSAVRSSKATAARSGPRPMTGRGRHFSLSCPCDWSRPPDRSGRCARSGCDRRVFVEIRLVGWLDGEPVFSRGVEIGAGDAVDAVAFERVHIDIDPEAWFLGHLEAPAGQHRGIAGDIAAEIGALRVDGQRESGDRCGQMDVGRLR
jgi:PAS domain S-box-containing protein